MLDKITVTLRNKSMEFYDIYIDVVDNPLSEKWLSHLTDVLKNNLHLEKNYHWQGFEERNSQIICDDINHCITEINLHASVFQSGGLTPYMITDQFSPDNVITHGPVGDNLPGLNIDHNKMNWLHRYFEDLQGHSGNISRYYQVADPNVKLCIRKLNLLCHELENYVLSERKRQYAPEWAQYNQLFCFLNSPRFKLDPETDYDLFGMHTLVRNYGDVYIGVNKSVSKTHWEVFQDEGDTDLDDLVTTSLRPQIEASADFDVYWGQSNGNRSWTNIAIDDFTAWLKKHGWDPEDPALTLGHPLIARVNVEESFGTDDFAYGQKVLADHLDVYSIKCDQTGYSVQECLYDYHWSDTGYDQLQVNLIS